MIAAVALVVLVPTLTVLAVRHQHHSQPAAAGVSTNPADLVGVEWQLIRSADAKGVSQPAPTGVLQQLLSFDGEGGISFTVNCNSAGGDVKLSRGKLAVSQTATNTMGCARGGDNSMTLLEAPPAAKVSWQIADHVLTLTAADGRKLIFAVRTSIYPSEYPASTSITIVEGKHGTADYRLSYLPANAKHVWFSLEARDAPGEGWSESGTAQVIGWTGPEPDWNGGCQPIDIAGERYLAGWATANAARVTVRSGKTGSGVTVALHKLTGTGGLQVYGGFVGQAPKGSTVSIYDSRGTLLGKPCPFGV
ncbi:MAG: META domain-containing protein [Jatrophihabitans sp.]